jgi:hypothetical protein
MIKTVADQVGVQKNGDQLFDETGHLESSYVSSRSQVDKTTVAVGSAATQIYNDRFFTESNQSVNLGFTPGN